MKLLVQYQIARWSISKMRGTRFEECSQPLCAGLPVKTTTTIADHNIEGDIFKNVRLCQLDVKKAILKSVRPGFPPL
jgi:hypothetical protein